MALTPVFEKTIQAFRIKTDSLSSTITKAVAQDSVEIKHSGSASIQVKLQNSRGEDQNFTESCYTLRNNLIIINSKFEFELNETYRLFIKESGSTQWSVPIILNPVALAKDFSIDDNNPRLPWYTTKSSQTYFDTFDYTSYIEGSLSFYTEEEDYLVSGLIEYKIGDEPLQQVKKSDIKIEDNKLIYNGLNPFFGYLDKADTNNNIGSLYISYKTAKGLEGSWEGSYDLKNRGSSSPGGLLQSWATDEFKVTNIDPDTNKETMITYYYPNSLEKEVEYKNDLQSHILYTGFFNTMFLNESLLQNFGISKFSKKENKYIRLFDTISEMTYQDLLNFTSFITEADEDKSIDRLQSTQHKNHGSARYYYDLEVVNSTNSYEDIYLLSNKGEKQYRIRFNPKLTSYKYNYADAVTPTLGGAYPFVRRNGNQKYRTFQISGLISKLQEEDGLTRAQSEREYREELIKFLHDGQVKLFKSPQEGLMLVQLSNINLTGEEKLGRELYSFTAQATEVGGLNYEDFKRLNFYPYQYEITANEWVAIT